MEHLFRWSFPIVLLHEQIYARVTGSSLLMDIRIALRTVIFMVWRAPKCALASCDQVKRCVMWCWFVRRCRVGLGQHTSVSQARLDIFGSRHYGSAIWMSR